MFTLKNPFLVKTIKYKKKTAIFENEKKTIAVKMLLKEKTTGWRQKVLRPVFRIEKYSDSKTTRRSAECLDDPFALKSKTYRKSTSKFYITIPSFSLECHVGKFEIRYFDGTGMSSTPMTFSEKDAKPPTDTCPRSCEVEVPEKDKYSGGSICWGIWCKNLKTNTFRCHCPINRTGPDCGQMNKGFRRKHYGEEECQ